MNIVNPAHNNLSDIVIVHGQNSVNELVRQGVSPKKIRVLPYGQNDIFDYGRDLTEESSTVLFFGTARLNKGIDRLEKISQYVRDVVPDARFIVAGRSHGIKWTDEDILLKIMERLNDLPFFEIHDRYIPDDEVEFFFRRSTVVLLPYHEATQSGVAAIAYSFGKPIVATRVGNLPDIVEDGVTGLLADPKSNFDIAQKISALLQNKELRETLGKQAFRKANMALSWERIAEKEVRLYHEVLGIR